MTIVFNLFCILLLMGSFIGYIMLANKIIGLRKEFIPVFVFSSIACIIYLCGVLDILFAGSIIVMMCGLIIFFTLFLGRLKEETPFYLSFSLFDCFWIVGCLFFFSLLLRSNLIYDDNFSHWALVLKHMLSTHTFPTMESQLIDFKSCPLGVSSFVYYICRFAGNSQSIMITAQGLLVFSCFYALFGIISEKKRFLLYAFLGLGCICFSFFNLTSRINSLSVDFLLPLYTLAIFSIAYQYQPDYWKSLISVLPLAGLLMITHSTGIIFAIIGLGFLIYRIMTSYSVLSKKRRLFLSLCMCFVTFLPYMIWKSSISTHLIDIQNPMGLSSTAFGKTQEQIQEITSLFVHSSLDFSTSPAIGIFVLNLIALIAIIFNLLILKKKWHLWKSLFILDIIVFLYYIGIWSVYVFYTPLEDALLLVEFERYISRIIILLAGGLVLTATVDMENSFYYRIGEVPDERAFLSVTTKELYQKSVLACMSISILLMLSEYNRISAMIQNYDTSLPSKMKTITGDRWYLNGEKDNSHYLLYAPNKDFQVTSLRMQYIGKYLLYTPFVDSIYFLSEDTMDSLLGKYDYLIVVESDLHARRLLYKHYGVIGQEGIYKIINTNGQIYLTLEE